MGGLAPDKDQPKSAQLPPETLATMLACLQSCAGSDINYSCQFIQLFGDVLYLTKQQSPLQFILVQSPTTPTHMLRVYCSTLFLVSNNKIIFFFCASGKYLISIIETGWHSGAVIDDPHDPGLARKKQN